MQVDTSNPQLLILGNGFDMAAGLASGFKDFFDSRQGMINAGEYLNTAWDEIFAHWRRNHTFSSDDASWRDVENEMYAFLTTHEKIVTSIMMYIRLRQIGLNSSGETTLNAEKISSAYDLTEREAEGILRLSRHIYNIVSARYSNVFSEALEQAGIDVFYSGTSLVPLYEFQQYDFGHMTTIYLDELHLFESDFKKHLDGAVEDKKEAYVEAAQAQFDKLLEDLVPLADKQSTYVMNFNYTMKTWRTDSYETPRSHALSVHGNLDAGDIVFGIDSFHIQKGETDEMLDAKLLPFSKTYRTLMFATPNRVKLDVQNFKVLKFYGQSLGVQDYSYFMSLFDEANLYGGDITLIFYYSLYPGVTEKQVQMETFNRVSVLINRYGQTLDNEAHGRNLLHKLQLEGRIIVRRIEFTDNTEISK